jgi:hypothetical protein
MNLDILKVKTTVNIILDKDHSIKLSHSSHEFDVMDLVNEVVAQKLPFCP